MSESIIERAYCKKIRSKKGIAYKFVSPGRRGVPDRLVLLPILKEHIDIVNCYVKFIEFKDTGEKPKAHQVREHGRLKKLGFNVEIIDQ